MNANKPTTEGAPERCPKCGGNESRVIHTVILGWECQDCRIFRQTEHRDPSNRLQEIRP